MFKKTFIVLFIISLGVTAAVMGMQDEVQKNPSKFMQRKLDYSRNVVEGLATENYELISKAAQDLMLLSHEADWNVVTTPEYLKLSSEFRVTSQRLREAGREKNLDGATLAYFEVTMNCVRCHKQIRKSPDK